MKETYISDDESDESPKMMSNKAKFEALQNENEGFGENTLARDPSTFGSLFAKEEEKVTTKKNQELDF